MTPAFHRHHAHPLPTLPNPFSSLTPRTATLVLAALGTSVNSYATYKILSYVSHRPWDSESEAEGLFSLKVDGARALGAIVCAYFFVGSVASAVGLVGVLKRRTSNIRLFRDYCLADLAFGFFGTAMLAVFAKKGVLRGMVCEELSRQPDIMSVLSEGAGLNIENCEGFLKRAFFCLVGVSGVILFIRLQFTLTVVNYYTYLRRTEQRIETLELQSSSSSSSRRSRSHSRSSSQRILILSQPSFDDDTSRTIIYAPVQLSAEQARTAMVREAYVTYPSRRSSGDEGRIRLDIQDGEGLSGKAQ